MFKFSASSTAGGSSSTATTAATQLPAASSSMAAAAADASAEDELSMDASFFKGLDVETALDKASHTSTYLSIMHTASRSARARGR